MKTITVFETAAELFNAASRVRHIDDNSPALPPSVHLLLSGGECRLTGEGSEHFSLGDAVGCDEITHEGFSRLGLPLDIE